MEIIIPKYVDRVISSAEALGEDIELGFTPRVLVHVTMPQSDPGTDKEGKPLASWERTNGLITLSMQSGLGLKLPYGSTPRMLLAWAATEVKRKKERILQLGPSCADFLEKLDIPCTTGKNGEKLRMETNLKRLFSASVITTIKKIENNEKMEERSQFFIADKYKLWEPLDGEEIKWKSYIKLSQVFFDDLLNNIVPIDITTLRLLRRSPLAIDIYNWLTDRMYRLKRPTKIPWPLLHLQFGSGYAETKQGRFLFKENFLLRLKTVMFRYTEANVEILDDGVLLKPSRTHINKLSTVL